MCVFQGVSFSGLEVVLLISVAGDAGYLVVVSVKLAHLKYIQSCSASTSSSPFWQESACQKMSVILK